MLPKSLILTYVAGFHRKLLNPLEKLMLICLRICVTVVLYM